MVPRLNSPHRRSLGGHSDRAGEWLGRGIRPCLPCLVLLVAAVSQAQSVSIDTGAGGRAQTIDGFGTCLAGDDGSQDWFKALYFDDLRASMLRMDITPPFKSPYSDFHYNAPWYSNDPALPGPEGNNVRTYTGPSDYRRLYAGRQAAIAVMGPDIDRNVDFFDFGAPQLAGTLAQLGQSKRGALGDFKLIASIWSPAPWVKVTSGGAYGTSGEGMPAEGTPWPFIWGGNFAGGKLDVSGEALDVFDDGTGPTSALTQFARTMAAYLRGFQNTFGVKVYAVSIQNELNFEEFYNSATYPQAPAYVKALKAARAELDKYSDLAPIRLMGPEDLLGDSAYSLWQYGSGTTATHKNLQYLAAIDADPLAKAALAHACIHGYANDGVTAAGASPTAWGWWTNGWSASPASGIPAGVKGTASLGLKSWMTETSGENTAWLSPTSGFPGDGAFGIALKLHQALTAGGQSAWLYWQLSDGKPVGAQTLTDEATGAGAPKYVAVKHFFRDIRPGAVRVNAVVSGAANLLASAYLHEAAGSLTVVLVNTDTGPVTVAVGVPAQPTGIKAFELHTSSAGSYWQASTAAPSAGQVRVPVPAYGVVTMVGVGQGQPGLDGGSPADGSASDADAGSGDAGVRDSGAPDGSMAAGDSGADRVTGPDIFRCGCAAADGTSIAGLLVGLAACIRRRRSLGRKARQGSSDG